ncbi:MAG TPA: class I SAM-dependent methyltransferase [Polyangiales bacterium]|nr:class I SAM-dependent methyltransferase [Polyangiales bacterium]
MKFEFDEAYYRRYYEDPKTRVASEADAKRLAQLLGAYLSYLDQPVRNVLDLGAGMGQMRAALRGEFPNASYLGVERSEYACRRFQLRQGSVVDFKARGRFDLVICKGVLQYLDKRDCERALANLAELCRGCLYLEALTREDWEENCDRTRTDGAVHLRPAKWYRERLRKRFRSAGAGVFVHERSPVVLYSLETA